MALQSQLFRGDGKLEAAGVSDAAHIVQGASGEHVRKIQLALIELDRAKIDPDGIYGSATAAAVLEFKRRRNIINRNYQTQPDNIVGKLTIAALDREMAAEDNKPVDDAGRIHCRNFPLPGRPVLPFSFAVGSRSAAASPIGRAAAPSPSAQALGRVQGAAIQVSSALNFIGVRKAQLLSGIPDRQSNFF